MLGDAVLPQNPPPNYGAFLEKNIERLETHNGFVGWDSEAPSIIGSSYYSTENEDFQVGYSINHSIDVPLDNVSHGTAPTPTHAEDDSHVPGVTDGVKIQVWFILREGHDWVEKEDLSVDPSDLS